MLYHEVPSHKKKKLFPLLKSFSKNHYELISSPGVTTIPTPDTLLTQFVLGMRTKWKLNPL